MSRPDAPVLSDSRDEPSLCSVPSAPEPKGVRLGTRTYWRISIALFLAGYATFSLLYCTQPLLPVLAETFGVSPAASSLSLSFSTGFLAAAIFCAGAVSESLGRKSLMFASLCGAAAFNLLAAAAPTWGILLAARALEGIALGGVPAVAMAYLAEEIDPRGLGLAMGLYISGSAFGGMAGRVVVGFVTEYATWRTALAVTGIAGLATALGFLMLLPPSRNFTPRRSLGLATHLGLWGGHLSNPGLDLLFLIGFLSMGTFVTVYNYAGFRLMAPPYGLSHAQVGLIFTAYMFGIVSSSVAGALADRAGRNAVMIGGVLVSLAGLALTVLAPLAAMIAGICLMTVGFFATHSIASGWVGRTAREAKGHAASLYLLAYYLGSSLAGSAGGWFWNAGRWPAVAGMCAVLLLVDLAAAWAAGRSECLPRI